jgi:hypothetical protein
VLSDYLWQMQYIDFEKLEQIDGAAYRAAQPFPWINPEGLLTTEGYTRLRESLPDIALFESSFGIQRKHQQQAHDRYILEYHRELSVAQAWHECIGELTGQRYKDNLCRLLGQRSVVLNFHWHYTPDGCCVSPHADSVRKAGSHIFYFNTLDDWDPSWGGHTVLLDDGGVIPYRSSPQFDDFKGEVAAAAIGNRSLLFSRTDRAWHGVRKVSCPPGKLRKVFIVGINRDTARDRLRRTFRRSQFHYF